MQVIAVMNQKGGVGKTTTAVNLAVALARRGGAVWLLDLDPQAHASLHLGVLGHECERNIYHVLTGSSDLAAAAVSVRADGLRLVPSDIALSGVEVELAGVVGRERVLAEAIDKAAADGAIPADALVLLDCPPSLGVITINALTAARWMLLPVHTEFLALHGIAQLMHTLDLVRRRLNPALALLGVLACRHDARRRLARDVLAEIQAHFPDRLLKTIIRENVRLAEAPSHARSIFEHAPTSTGAEDYAALAAEILERLVSTA